MIIAVDFDGTITRTNSYPEIGELCPGAIESLKFLKSRGHRIVLNTMRSGVKLTDAINTLKDNDIYLYGVNSTPGQSEWTKSPKVYANIYIDDQSVGIPRTEGGYLDWNKIVEELIDRGF